MKLEHGVNKTVISNILFKKRFTNSTYKILFEFEVKIRSIVDVLDLLLTVVERTGGINHSLFYKKSPFEYQD